MTLRLHSCDVVQLHPRANVRVAAKRKQSLHIRLEKEVGSHHGDSWLPFIAALLGSALIFCLAGIGAADIITRILN